MHPIERLRYVARAEGAPPDLLVQETAAALSAFRRDPRALVTATRRIVSRQPTAGVLVWLAARVLAAPEPLDELFACAEAVEDDRTGGELHRGLPSDATVVVVGRPHVAGPALGRRGDVEVLVVDVDGDGRRLVDHLARVDVAAHEVPPAGLASAVAAADLVLLEPAAIGPTSMLAPTGSLAVLAAAQLAERPTWIVGGVGRLLPQLMWDGFAARAIPTDVAAWEADDEVVPVGPAERIVGPWGVLPVADALRRCDCPVIPEVFAGDVR